MFSVQSQSATRSSWNVRGSLLTHDFLTAGILVVADIDKIEQRFARVEASHKVLEDSWAGDDFGCDQLVGNAFYVRVDATHEQRSNRDVRAAVVRFVLNVVFDCIMQLGGSSCAT